MWMPKGYLPLREAVVRTAEHLAPRAGVRAYLEQPNPAAAGWNALQRAVAG